MELKVSWSECVALLLAMGLCCLCLASQTPFKAPEPTGEYFFAESFGKGTLDGWVISSAKKEGADEDVARYDGKWEVEELKHGKLPGDKGLVLKSPLKHHAISAHFPRPFIFDTQPLVVQYEVNFQTVIDCGGAYLKLLTHTTDLNLKRFADTTPYTIMFGPDKCGHDYKLHFIFRHKNPRTGVFEEKHAKKPDVNLKSYFTDKRTHLYTLVVKPDNSFEILVDQMVVNSGNLLTDMTPPVNPPAEIKDPDDRRPEDWDAKILEPNAVKPDDWNEDPPTPDHGVDAVSGGNTESAGGEDMTDESDVDDEDEDMDDELDDRMYDRDEDMDDEDEDEDMDDETEAASKPRKIPNPDFFKDLHPFRMSPIGAVGLELWSTSSDMFFDNFLITSDHNTAESWAKDGWGLKREGEGDAEEEEEEDEDDAEYHAEEEAEHKAEESAEEPVALPMMSTGDEHPWSTALYVAMAVALTIVLISAFHYKKKTYDADYGYDAYEEEDDSEDSDNENEGVTKSTRRRRKLKKFNQGY